MKLWLIGSALLMVGCQVIDPPDPVATLNAENSTILEEATAIAQAAEDDRMRIESTAADTLTQVAEMSSQNQVLLATVRASDPVGPRVVAQTDTQPVLTPGQRWFSKTGVAAQINEADGCVVGAQIRFSQDTPVIYATMRVFNIESGVQLSAVWAHEGTEMHRESFVLNRGASEICIWFSLESSVIDLLPGNWTVQLYADGARLEQPMQFTVEAGEAMMEG